MRTYPHPGGVHPLGQSVLDGQQISVVFNNLGVSSLESA